MLHLRILPLTLALLLAGCASSGPEDSGYDFPTSATGKQDGSGVPTFSTSELGSWRELALAYAPDNNFDANFCEFYIDGFALGSANHNSTHLRWVQADFVVEEAARGEEILGAGMYAQLKAGNEASQDIEALFFADEVEAGQYALKVAYEHNAPEFQAGFQVHSIERLAFFMDVSREDGDIDRLWVSNGGEDFDLGDIFDGQPTEDEPLGLGTLSHVQGGPVLHQRDACK